MTLNPWQVESIEAFYYLNCPECSFNSKDEIGFQDHAIENHPLSFVFFGKFETNESISEIDAEMPEISSAGIKQEFDDDFTEEIDYYDQNIKQDIEEEYDNDLQVTTIENVHEEKMPYLCGFCNDGFTDKKTLKSHVTSVHDDQSVLVSLEKKKKEEREKMCKCTICNAVFKKPYKLRTHFFSRMNRNK